MVTNIQKLLRDKKYKIFKDFSHPYNLNIIGVRNVLTKVDKFDDKLVVFWKEKAKHWEYREWPITTRPGAHWLLFPLNPNGTAIMVPGQYLGAYSIGKYRGKDVLRQVEPVKVYRDKNGDSEFNQDSATIEEGVFGLHIHRAGAISNIVGLHSAGCQVFQKQADFEDFMTLCASGAESWGNKFSYTLLELKDELL